MANRTWKDESSAKGRIVMRPSKISGISRAFTDSQILDLFGWGKNSSIWANPCNFRALKDFQGATEEDITEKVGFLAWDLASKSNEIKVVTYNNKESSDAPRQFYSVCGYMPLMPHLHNFTNVSNIIQDYENFLVDDLIFHLFGKMEKSLKGLPRYNLQAYGYTIRFDELTVGPLDNAESEEDADSQSIMPTNRTARSKIYCAILVDKEQVDNAFPAHLEELMLDPKKEPAVVRNIIPDPEVPDFTPEELAQIEKLPTPVGQFGLSSLHTRREQLKLYSIVQLKADPDLPIPNPDDAYNQKLRKYLSTLPEEKIYECLEGAPVGRIMFYDEPTNVAFPSETQLDDNNLKKLTKEGMFYMPILTDIDYNVHPDPEKLFYDLEHDETIKRLVRDIHFNAILEPEVLGDWIDEEKTEKEVIEPSRRLPKRPRSLDIISLADEIGYLRTEYISNAKYKTGSNVNTWIIVVGIKYGNLVRSETYDFPHPDDEIVDEEKLQSKPDDPLEWVRKVGENPWLVVRPEKVKKYAKKGRSGKVVEVGSVKNRSYYYYVHETNYEYHVVKYDRNKLERLRNEATVALYDKVSPPRTLDYRTVDFKYTRMPHTGKCAILVAVRKEWVDRQPIKSNSKPSVVPGIVTAPKLKNGPGPFINWTKTSRPFPTWFDPDREKHYTIIEAEQPDKYIDPTVPELSLKMAKEDLSVKAYEEILLYNGKNPTPNPSVTSAAYYKYFSDREPFPPIISEVYLDPKPESAPRVIVGVEKEFLEKLPDNENLVSDAEIEAMNEQFFEEKYLVLKLPMAGPGSSQWNKFSNRLGIAARVLRDHAKSIGPRRTAPNGLTQRELHASAKQVSNFMDDFFRLVMLKNEIRVDPGSTYVVNNLEEQNACEFYLYLDPSDYSLVDVFAFGKTRLTKGVSDFKQIWSPPNSLAMQFVFWSGMTYIKTAQGRDDKFDFFDAMSILLDPFGALDGWLTGIDIPGMPKGFTGKLLANSVSAIKNPPKPLFGPGGEYAAWQARENSRIAQDEARKKLSDKIKNSPYSQLKTTDTSNPSVVDEDPSSFLAQLSAAGCGMDLLENILTKVNIFDLIMMYMKCLGIELPIDPRCLFNFPWPLFSLRFNIPKFTIPNITWADVWEIIRKIIYELLCQLIIQLLMMLIKEILDAVLALPGCESPDNPPFDLPFEPKQDFDDPDKSPKSMIDDAIKGNVPKGPFDSDNAEDFAKDMFGICQPGMHLDQYGEGRGPLNYFEDVAAILSTTEFCQLMYGEPTNDSLDRIVRFTKREYPGLYFQESRSIRESKVGKKKTKKGSTREPEPIPASEDKLERAYIGYPRPPGVPTAYKNFFLCIADHLKQQVNDLCDPQALKNKYGRPDLRQLTDDKCTLEDLQAAASGINDRLREALADKGLSDKEIEEQVALADREIEQKLQNLDAIQAAIDDFLDVVVPQITAPIVNSVEMNAFDNIFRSVRQQFTSGIGMIEKDANLPHGDLQMMVNYVVNSTNTETRPYRRRVRKFKMLQHPRFAAPIVFPRTYWGYSTRYRFASENPSDAFYIPPDPIFLHEKFKVRTQTWPDPDWWKWFQELITKPPWPLPGYEHQMLIPDSLQRQYCRIGYPPMRSFILSWMGGYGMGPNRSAAGEANVFDAADMQEFMKQKPQGLSNERWRDWETPNWFNTRSTGRFLAEQTRDLGNLGDVVPSFKQGKKNKKDGISEELIIGNEKFKFSVTLDKDGENFYYQIWKEADSVERYVRIPQEEWVPNQTNFYRLETVQLPRENVFEEPIKVDLSEQLWDPNKQEYVKKFPWWHERKVKKNKSGWIQRDEFIERFIADDHPLRWTGGWPNLAASLFQNIHDNFYVVYVENSIVEVIRRNPMKDFWLEEYYKAESYVDLQENKIPDRDLMTRNRLFNSEDPYYKLNDIKAIAKTMLEGKVADALGMDNLGGEEE